MNPVAFPFLGLDIRWYGVFIATGMVFGIIVANYTCRWRDLDFDTMLNVVLISLPFSIIGARLYYVIFEFNNYRNDFIQIFNIREGGLAIHGGVLFAVISTLIYTKYKKISFLKIADVAAPSIILGQSIGRWGNFFNQEAHGGAVTQDFIKHFPSFIQRGMNIEGVYYHPTFLYESFFNMFIFIILLIILKRSKKEGIVFFTYIGLYSIVRFIIEGLRTDSLMVGPMRIAQLVSIIAILAWLIFLFLARRNRKKIDK